MTSCCASLRLRASAALLALCVPAVLPPARAGGTDSPALTREQAGRLAGLALGCVGREYPNKLDHVMNDAGEVQGPRALHPAFYGCFDWHSAVHGHWLLVRLLRRYPDLPQARTIRGELDSHLTADSIRIETEYL